MGEPGDPEAADAASATAELRPASTVDGGAPASSPPAVRALGLALVVSLALWQLPFGGFLLYPFKLLATWMHELSHGLVMMATGAGFDRMEVYRDGSGLAYWVHGVGPVRGALIAAAGYMGTPVFGVALLVAGQTVRGARWALAAMGALLLACVLLVVANQFGQVSLAATGAVVVAVAVLVPGRWAVLGAHFVAAQACVNAVLDIRVLFRPVMVVDGHVAGGSDASRMALATFGTDASWAIWLWASLWLAWSLALLFVALRWVRSRR
jgi:Peptidase M50B-like